MTEVYNSMITGYIIGAIISLVINGFLARIPARMAQEKGYSYGGYWCLSFFFTFIAGMLVAACIPDRNIHKKSNDVYSTNQNNASASNQYNNKQSCNQNTITNVVKLSEKQIRSFEFGYSLDVAVQITKAELLFDEAQASLHLNLEIYNVSNKNITFLDMSIECYDTVGDKLSDDYIVEHSYMNIFVHPQEAFKEALIKLNDTRIRNMKVNIKKLMYEDGEVVRYTGNELLVECGDRKEVSSLPYELYEVYKEYVVQRLVISTIPIKYFPQLNANGSWTCCCGRINTLLKEKCCLCGREKQSQFDFINEEFIKKTHVQQIELKKRQVEESRRQHEIDIKAIEEARRKSAQKREEARRLQEEKEAKKRKIIWITFAGIIIVIILLILVLR